jgi:hypothetical protein
MLRLDIAGLWYADDLVDVIQSIQSLYYIGAGVLNVDYDLFWYPRRGGFFSRRRQSIEDIDVLRFVALERARLYASTDIQLAIRKIEYSSPGGIDLAGIGQVTEALDKILGRLIDLATGRKKRKEGDKQAEIETAIKSESLRAMMIQNARDILELRKDFPAEEIEFLIDMAVRDQEIVMKRIVEGKIVGSRTIEEQGPDNDG